MERSKKKKRGISYWFPAILMILMVLVVMVQVCTRLMGNPVTWGEEIARWLLIWIIFSGLYYAFEDGGLISVDFFVKKFKPSLRKKIKYFNMLTTILYFAIVFVCAGMYFQHLAAKGQVFPVTKMPATLTVAAMLVGSVLAIVYAVRQIKTIKSADIENEEGNEQ